MKTSPVPPRLAFEALAQGFEKAATDGDLSQFDILLCGRRVRIRSADARLSTLFRDCYGHLLAEPEAHGKTDATIDLWSSPAAGHAEGFTPLIDTRPDNLWGCLICDPERLWFHDWRAASDAALDVTQMRIVGHLPAPSQLTIDERAKPLHRLLGGLLSRWRVAMVHASMVGVGGRAVMMAGAGGSGKSTTALAARMLGLDYLGDDYVGLEVSGGQVLGHGLFATGLAGPGPIDALPRRSDIDITSRAGDEKRLFSMKGGIVRNAEVVSLLLPRVSGLDSTLFQPASERDFLLAAAPYSLLYNAQDRNIALDVMTKAAATTPIQRMMLGRDVAEVVATLRALLEG